MNDRTCSGEKRIDTIHNHHPCLMDNPEYPWCFYITVSCFERSLSKNDLTHEVSSAITGKNTGIKTHVMVSAECYSNVLHEYYFKIYWFYFINFNIFPDNILREIVLFPCHERLGIAIVIKDGTVSFTWYDWIREYGVRMKLMKNSVMTGYRKQERKTNLR